MAEIRNQGLYKTSHLTFEDYCRDRWQMAARTAYQMIRSSEACNQLSGLQLPSNESVARVLAEVSEPDRRDAWLLAIRAEQHVTAERLRNFLKGVRQIRYNHQNIAPVGKTQCPKCGEIYDLLQPEKSSRGNRRPSWCISWVASKISGTAIDYGCGRFRNTEEIKKHFRLVASVDTPIQVERVRPIMPQENLLTVEQFLASEVTADVVFLISILHVVPDETCAEICRIAKAKAKWIVVEFPRNQTYYRGKMPGRQTKGSFYREPTEEQLQQWIGSSPAYQSSKAYSKCRIFKR